MGDCLGDAPLKVGSGGVNVVAEVVAEVTAACERYEKALLADDIDTIG